jgi:hypothetical protein
VHLPKSTPPLGILSAPRVKFRAQSPTITALLIEFIVGMSIALILSKSTKTAVRRIVEAALAETLGTSSRSSHRGTSPHRESLAPSSRDKQSNDRSRNIHEMRHGSARFANDHVFLRERCGWPDGGA